jgi:hypothetical protein
MQLREVCVIAYDKFRYQRACVIALERLRERIRVRRSFGETASGHYS